MKSKKPNVLYFDIETLPLKCFFWQPGTQYVGHKNMLPSHDMWGLICIQYAVNDGPVKVLRYDKHGGTKGMIEKFDKLVSESDYILGKNSDRFDVKMLTAMRMMCGLPAMTGWEKYTEDLERHMRRYFRLPSQSLDYISQKMGVGGKVSMQMSDWVEISNMKELQDLKATGVDSKSLNKVSKHLFKMKASEVFKLGKASLNKMCTYGAKDTDDTRILWKKLLPHFDPKFNAAKFNSLKHACKHCASKNIIPVKHKMAGKTTYQVYKCGDCRQYAGRAPVSAKGTIGQIG